MSRVEESPEFRELMNTTIANFNKDTEFMVTIALPVEGILNKEISEDTLINDLRETLGHMERVMTEMITRARQKIDPSN